MPHKVFWLFLSHSLEEPDFVLIRILDEITKSALNKFGQIKELLLEEEEENAGEHKDIWGNRYCR